jgi:multidrug efflux pump
MNISEPFIRRPVATSLLSVALLLAGLLAYRMLPVAPLPQVEFPVIQVQAQLPGASPETMASSVATPLERQFARIAGVTEMTSTSLLGATTIVLQFDLDRSIDAAARDVQAAINAALSQLPPNLPSNPNYRKINPADAPVLILGMTSDAMPVGRIFDAADSIVAQRLSQVEGVGQVFGRRRASGGARQGGSQSSRPARDRAGAGADRARCGHHEPAQGRAVRRRLGVGRQQQLAALRRRSVPPHHHRVP